MALFRCASGSSGGGATITVTYSSDFYGETVTCSHGTKTYSKVATSSGTLEFSVDEEGTWTISCTIGGDTFTTTADVDLTYDAELVSLPDGETVLPTDDIETWLACAAITDKAYTTLTQVLGDSETYNALLGDSNACAYMKRSTTWSTDICASQYAMNLLGQYDTACDALLSDSTWASAIANSTYFESVLNVKVPVMTSNTTPSGTVHASVENISGAPPYYAFDGQGGDGTSDVQHFWADNTVATFVSPCYLQYTFDAPVVANKVRLVSRLANYFYPKDFTIYGSNDGGVTKVTLLTVTNHSSSDYVYEDTIGSNTAYTTYGADFTSSNAGNIAINVLQFYGRATSSEKIHGANGESAYILDGGSPVTITDPSTLSAGTYTVYSTVAKNPSDLTADYSKTIRICPNTKEIVVRPDNALYWWGHNGGMEDCTSANGWTYSNATLAAPTHNMTSVNCVGLNNTINAFATTKTYGQKTVHYILKATSGARYLFVPTKNASSGYNTFNTAYTSLTHITKTSTASTYIGVEGYYNTETVELFALWYE